MKKYRVLIDIPEEIFAVPDKNNKVAGFTFDENNFGTVYKVWEYTPKELKLIWKSKEGN